MSNKIDVETLLKKPYWLIDILPKKVPAEAAGQYFKVEHYFLDRLEKLSLKFSDMLLKLNCYMDLSVSHDGENWTLNPAPEDLAVHFRESIDSRSSLFILVEPCNAVLTFSGDEHWMTLYNSDGDLLSLIRELASSEGLFVWKPNML